jgi:hypothetical protein
MAVVVEREAKTPLAPTIIFLVLIERLCAETGPLFEVLAVPHDCVAIGAVTIHNRHERHGKVLPDALAKGDIRDGPVFEDILFPRKDSLVFGVAILLRERSRRCHTHRGQSAGRRSHDILGPADIAPADEAESDVCIDVI